MTQRLINIKFNINIYINKLILTNMTTMQEIKSLKALSKQKNQVRGSMNKLCSNQSTNANGYTQPRKNDDESQIHNLQQNKISMGQCLTQQLPWSKNNIKSTIKSATLSTLVWKEPKPTTSCQEKGQGIRKSLCWTNPGPKA